jgi:acyl carrier protein
MTTEDFLKAFEQITESAPSSIRTDTPLTEVGGWDSLAVIGLISRLDRDFGLRLRADDLPQCATVGDVANLITS